MNKTGIIIIASLIVIALISILGYLLFFKETTNNQENNFSFPETGVDNTNNEGEAPKDNNDNKDTAKKDKLRQITKLDKKVANFSEINAPQTGQAPTVYYVEQGTGHVFSINLENDEETRISNTTIPDLDSAEISPRGDFVAFSIRSNKKSHSLILGEIVGNSELKTQNFSKEVDDFQFDKEGNYLLYTTKGSNGLDGFSYNLKTGVHKKIFALPFYEATIQWGETVSDPIFAYPKPSYLLEGALYEIKNGNISRLPISGKGLFALANQSTVSFSVTDTQTRTVKNFLYDRANGNKIATDFSLLPEKCFISSAKPVLICAFDTTKRNEFSNSFPDRWYRGEIIFSDALFKITSDNSNAEASLLADIEVIKGRNVDVTDLKIGSSEEMIYFINKNDNSLWVYEI